MELKILEEKENLLLKRKEVKAEIIHPNLPTPKREEVVASLAKLYSVDPTQVLIDYIFTKKGTNSSLVKIKILKEKPKIEGEKVEAQASKSG